MATFLTMASTVLAIPFVTRLLSPAEYGEVLILLGVAQVIGILGNLGLPGAITRAFFLEKAREGDANRLLIEGIVLAAMVFGLLVATGTVWWTRIIHTAWAAPAVLTLGYGGTLAIAGLILALARAREKPLLFVFVAISGPVGGPFIGVAVISIGAPSVTLYLGAMFLASLVGTSLGIVLLYRQETLRLSSSAGFRRRALKISLPTIPHVLALQAYLVALRLLIERSNGVEAVASFHVVYTVGTVGLVVTGAINNAWAPIIYRADQAKRLAVLKSTTSLVLAVAGVVSALAILLSPTLIAVLAPGEYRLAQSDLIVGCLAASAPIFVWYLANVHMLFVDGTTLGLAVVTPLAALIGLGAVAVGISEYFAVVALGPGILYLLAGMGVRLLVQRRHAMPKNPAVPIAATLLVILGGATSVLPDSLPWQVLRVTVGAVLLMSIAFYVQHQRTRTAR